MTEKIRKVSEHGPPDPEQWVMKWHHGFKHWSLRGPDSITAWCDDDEWFPTDPPPTEYVEDPEPEWVEVDGADGKWRLRDGHIEHQLPDDWMDEKWDAAEVCELIVVAAALGLVDQPTVPKKLVDWLERVEAHKPNDTGMGGRRDMAQQMLGLIQQGFFGPVEWEWVTDRLPRDDEYPVIVYDGGKFFVERGCPTLVHTDRWVSMSNLLGDR